MMKRTHQAGNADNHGSDSPVSQTEATILARAFDYAPDAQLLVDTDGCIIKANHQAVELFGYSQEELLGNSIESLIPERFVPQHAIYRKGFMDSPRSRPMGAGVELFARHKNGTEVPVGIMLSYIETGSGLVALAVVRDISERKKAEEKFQALLESAPDAKVIVNEQGLIQIVNSQTEAVFGYPREELLGQPVEKLIPRRYHTRHLQHRTGYFSAPEARPMGPGQELYGLRKNGEEFPIEIRLSPLQTEDGLLISSAIRDITQRKAVEEQLRKSLEEKETLLHEIHHRVKNNLAVIGSTFYLQSTYVEDEKAMEILQNCQDRVRSMALVHDRLYHSGNFSAVDFGEYTRELCTDLFSNYAVNPDRIQLSIDIDSIDVGLNQAVPCALILNELVSNSLKHAFPDDHQGVLRIQMRNQNTGGLQLTVADNGIGMPDAPVSSDTGSFGMRLLRTLTRQVDGTIEYLPGNPGTIARLNIVKHAQF